jgi:integrase
MIGWELAIRPWRVEETPYPKKRFRLPVILSQDEVARLIESAATPFHRTILMTLYATGVRRAELANLKVATMKRFPSAVTSYWNATWPAPSPICVSKSGMGGPTSVCVATTIECSVDC